MNNLICLADLHLDHCAPKVVDAFIEEINSRTPAGVLIAGDIGQADTVCGYLERLASEIDAPIFFVLGNHDFYGGNLDRVHESIKGVCKKHDNLTFLPTCGNLITIGGVTIIGANGWGDGEHGNVMESTAQLNDFVKIEDLSWLNPRERRDKLLELGESEAAILDSKLSPAVKFGFNRILVVTHVPPFIESAWHEGKPSNNDFAPFFVCKSTGDVIRDTAHDNPEIDLTVICGHTHSGGVYSPLPNVTVHTLPAEYGKPEIHLELGL